MHLVHGQSARLEALGNNFCIDDFSSIVGNAAQSVNYRDAIQGTAYMDGTFGPVIGLKSIGKALTLGFAANVSEDYRSVFYSDAVTFLNETIDTSDSLPEKFSPFPHIIMGLSLPFMTLGAEWFYEKTSLSTKHTGTDSLPSVNKSIANTGMSLNLSFTPGIFGIYPFLTYGVPSLSGSLSRPVKDSTITVSTSGNKTIKAGVEFGLFPKLTSFSVGGIVFDESYNLECDSSGRVNQPRYHTNSINLYAGVNAYPVDNLLLACMYSFEHSQYTYKLDYIDNGTIANIYDSWESYNHFIAGSCEIIYALARIEMTLYIRGGLSWTIQHVETNNRENSFGYTSDLQKHYPHEVSQIVPTVGLGLQKSIIQFDLSSRLANWSGVVSGMPVVTGTLTFNFSGIRKTNQENESVQ